MSDGGDIQAIDSDANDSNRMYLFDDDSLNFHRPSKPSKPPVQVSDGEIKAINYDANDGNRKRDGYVMDWDKDGSFVTYKSLYFGRTKGYFTAIEVTISKHNEGGEVIVKLGDKDGEEIARFFPKSTGGWHIFKKGYFRILKDIAGMHDLTFVATKHAFDFKSFKLLTHCK